jgi:uncharacterized protein
MKYFRLIGFVFLWLCSGLAFAQENQPLVGSQATDPQAPLVANTLSDGIYRILVIGDSIAGGLGNGMARMAANDTSYQVVSRFNESSGLTRPDFYDWAGAIPKIMEGKNFNAVVVLIGLNDRQDIRSASGRLAFGSPEWVAAYQANTDAIMDSLKTQNVKVFWLSEPPMGDPTYDADMMQVSTLQKDRVVPKGAVYVDTRALLLSPEGKYVDFGPDDTGEPRKLRQRDGVTFFKQGNNKFGQIVLATIKDANDGKLPDVPVAASGTPLTVDAPTGPVFGQDDGNGQSVLHGAGDVVASANTTVVVKQVIDPSVPAIGSEAEKLITTGEANVAPLGRFDDFSYVAPAQQ